MELIINNKTYNIEKEILIKKCEYFRAMFSGNFSENNSDKIEIKDNINFDLFYYYLIDDNYINIDDNFNDLYEIMLYFGFDLTSFLNQIEKLELKQLKLNKLIEIYNLPINLQNLFKNNRIENNIDINNIFDFLKILKTFNIIEKHINIFDLDIRYIKNDAHYQNIKHNDDENHILDDINEFYEKLEKYSFGIINENFRKLMKEKDIIIAGGSIFNILYKDAKNIENSDIDIYISNKEQLTELLKYFTLLNKYIIYGTKNSVIYIIIEGINRIFQIIYVEKNPINDFDMSYVRVYFDGENIYGTISFMESLSYLSIEVKEKDKKIRIRKAWNKGLSIKNEIEIDFMNLNEKEDEYLNQRYYYFNKDALSDVKRLKFLIKKCIGCDQIYDTNEELINNFSFEYLRDMNYDNMKYDIDDFISGKSEYFYIKVVGRIWKDHPNYCFKINVIDNDIINKINLKINKYIEEYNEIEFQKNVESRKIYDNTLFKIYQNKKSINFHSDYFKDEIKTNILCKITFKIHSKIIMDHKYICKRPIKIKYLE